VFVQYQLKVIEISNQNDQKMIKKFYPENKYVLKPTAKDNKQII